MITLEEYWQGRDVCYADQCTDEIKKNAQETVKRVNKFLTYAEQDGIIRNKVSSGWRPKGINDATSNAAKKSNHLIGKAIDVYDPDRKLAQWMINNKSLLSLCFIWAEDPRWTPTWVHLQIIPPTSQKLIYIPSLRPPLAPKLIGQTELPLTRII